MTVERANPSTLAELAAMSADKNVLYFGVGTTEGDELLRFTAANLTAGERLITIDTSAGCQGEIESPEQTPAIGAWISKGALIGYAYNSQGIVELMKDARRFLS
jgi:hypothetical protein